MSNVGFGLSNAARLCYLTIKNQLCGVGQGDGFKQIAVCGFFVYALRLTYAQENRKYLGARASFGSDLRKRPAVID